MKSENKPSEETGSLKLRRLQEAHADAQADASKAALAFEKLPNPQTFSAKGVAEQLASNAMAAVASEIQRQDEERKRTLSDRYQELRVKADRGQLVRDCALEIAQLVELEQSVRDVVARITSKEAERAKAARAAQDLADDNGFPTLRGGDVIPSDDDVAIAVRAALCAAHGVSSGSNGRSSDRFPDVSNWIQW